MMKKLVLIIVLFLLYNTVSANMKYSINGFAVAYNNFFWTVLPGDTLIVSFPEETAANIVLESENTQIIKVNQFNWGIVASDETGDYRILISNKISGEQFNLNVFVLIDASKQKGEYLNGYRIGNYPQKPFRNNPNYMPPKGFIEVTETNQNLFVSPHFQVKQFLCKQQANVWPKYVLIDPKLIVKLEKIIDGLNLKKPGIKQVFIMSGYRTPYYNASINNGKYSRHIYGDAADIYVDENRDGVIDDLNRDGIRNKKDAETIYQVIEEIERKPENKDLVGGLHTYNKTAAHTWDVHTDTRGYKARW